MEIVAQVFNWKITKTELDFEENQVRKQLPMIGTQESRNYAIDQLIDRYLLMQDAVNKGICINDEEFEEALFNLLDDMESPEASVLVNRKGREEQIERILKCHLIIGKYLDSLISCNDALTEKRIKSFYDEHIDFFQQKEEVRASHILIKGTGEDSLKKIREIKNSISSAEEFSDFSQCKSECPTGMNCGDLGFFPRGRMIPEIENVAFALKLNEISEPFKTRYGYHILMVTEKIEPHVIPFQDIKESLKESLVAIEQELARGRILSDMREHCQKDIKIFDNAFK